MVVGLLVAALASQEAGPILPAELLKLKSYAAAEKLDRPVLTFIHSDTCAVCRKTAPALVTAARRYAGRLGLVFYEVHKNNKPDEAVGFKFKATGTDRHHLTIMRPPPARPGSRPLPPGQQRPGTLDLDQDRSYGSVLRAIDQAYDAWLRAKVDAALDHWFNQQQVKADAGNDQQRARNMARRYTNGDPAAWLEADPFAEIADPSAGGWILDAIQESTAVPVEPVAAVSRLGRLGLTLTPALWTQRPLPTWAAWRKQWDARSRERLEAEAHKEVNDRIKDLLDKHPTVAASASLELMRLTGMDFEAGPDEAARKQLQAAWKDWYAKAKKDKTLVYDPVRHAFVPPPAEPGAVTDLLALVDPARDAVNGTWTRVEGALESGRLTPERIQVPVAPKGDYTVKVRYTRVQGQGGLLIVFPVGDRQVQAILDHGSNGLDTVDGQTWGNNQTSTQAFRGRDGQTTAVELKVVAGDDGQATIEVVVDDRLLIEYAGPVERLGMRNGFTLKDTSAIGFGAFGTTLRIQEATLQMQRGTLEKLANP
jgi:thiol-disulfide isomerase/thioredoxin